MLGKPILKSFHMALFLFTGMLAVCLLQAVSNLWLRLMGVMVVMLIFSKRTLSEYGKLKASVTLDDLTGIGNYRAFKERMSVEVQRALRHKSFLTLVLIDMDNFKSYNDKYGHRMGNSLLRASGQAFCQAVRTIDGVYRFGGDEFAVLLPETGLEEAKNVINRIHAKFNQLSIEGTVTLSMGMAAYRGQTVDEFFDVVDQLLYKVKERGGNCCLGESTVVLVSQVSNVG